MCTYVYICSWGWGGVEWGGGGLERGWVGVEVGVVGVYGFVNV